MRSIVQVEYRPSLLAIREETLAFLGHPVISVLGSQAARELELAASSVGVVVIGHRAERREREDLVLHFRQRLPGVPIVVLLGRSDDPFGQVDYNCPADNPPEWVRTVSLALTGIQ